ncbi:MAG: ABC transporter ATP-binding protein [Melioribacteraceae bacterium]|nr:ABC transporter ATP-binding protein [Melioribacteraceae bacterium]MCF8355647.1 ABC transporter ATP-binding protein [Melioribacteraceae bacterium]MCF8394653.1 ABC transporter ATP-binding protein [Melioribacteraceae bacterium]MCF8418013.1 ABC transporter ATP-binding protein [Melioribacteraceae bacterium]
MILTANNIYKSFAKTKDSKIEILKNVSLNLEEKKITVIVGASGAGKSTLLHILSGLDKPDAGSVKINDKDIFSFNDKQLSKFRNSHLGFVFQFHHLLPEFTAAENISIPILIQGKSMNEASERTHELLKSVGIAERADHKPSELSGGEQQRVAVARALANNPDIVFADEPTGNLDSANSEILHELFIKLKEEYSQTFLVVTHNPELIKLGDTILEMKDGVFI